MCPRLYLDNQIVKLVDSHKYLGVIISEDLCDNKDICKSTRTLYARGNSIISNFRYCTEDVKVQLFKSFCSTIYCCHLWSDFSPDISRRIKSAYNRIFRILFNLYHRVSMPATLLKYGVLHFDILVRNSITGFIKRIESSDNIIIQNIISSDFYINSAIYNHWKTMIY